ncbi:hypothetical protein ND861_09015 [Leptospira sp. 2 VSF19]|uniref:STAS domain protein n=1 Tax=Leptospira soteropolitanensis TaxID=2950025 RepID=A0AAW5VJJ6_9LEPT|nr:hypothetical protein [Leptospira soteropolitanensis]MCW7492657.1 hypothetical protein [Leptospira soteropolitanensis]MCW7500340.1 hypothetical protein [Leptospira soteropolitanensis]MCW7522625.1 hypothetical protein [Leptospira soteropolitanensis]MCW7526481.1 hypothetical protein [Leptospira soteropolitanensis]MCW7530310.1 hypothetical protein [Leptospira soteropolitanensis]
MAKKTKYLSVREVQNAYEIVILSKEVHLELEEELDSVMHMLFFQTRSHIQMDLSNLPYLPLTLLTKLLNMARDLRLKKRVLVLLGLPVSSYIYLKRFDLIRLVFPSPAILRESHRDPRG